MESSSQGHAHSEAASLQDGSQSANQVDLASVDNTLWDQDVLPNARGKKVNPVFRILLYVGLGLFSFFFFLYLTFPYGVLKEVAVVQLTQAIQQAGIPVRVSIGSLRPYWFTGIQAERIVITNLLDPKTTLRLTDLNVRASVLPLLWGELQISAHLAQKDGSMDATADLKLLPLLNQDAQLRFMVASFDNFSLDPVFNQALAVAKNSNNPGMVLIVPLLSKTTAGGALTGNMVLDNPMPANFNQAKGTVDLRINNGFLHIADETLQIPKQDFTAATFDIKFENGAITFGPTSKLAAKDIGLALAGTINLPEQQGMEAQANLDLTLNMSGQIEKNLGFIVPNILRCKPLVNGELKANLNGPVSNMACK